MKDTLVIIGNGFDLWQGINSTYASFKDYYYTHLDSILKKLHIKKKYILDDNFNKKYITDVDIIYGNPFSAEELDDDFWGYFENSLAEIDAELINLYFGKSRRELKQLRKSAKNAKKILTTAFTDWVSSLDITDKKQSFEFGDNCLFINFNYTDTLQRRFNIPDTDVFHIHGEASDKKSIIFGHSSHPQLPEPLLYKMGGRFRGLYLIEEVLFETDKHVQDNIQLLIAFLSLCGLNPADIKHVYVLGHSMSLPDIEYFAFLANATKTAQSSTAVDENTVEKMEADDLDELRNRIGYAINSYGYSYTESSEEEDMAIGRKLQSEQKARNYNFEKYMRKTLGLNKFKNLDEAPVIERKSDAKWHISYYSERDKIWIERILQELEVSNYKLYSSVEKCLEDSKNSRID